MAHRGFLRTISHFSVFGEAFRFVGLRYFHIYIDLSLKPWPSFLVLRVMDLQLPAPVVPAKRPREDSGHEGLPNGNGQTWTEYEPLAKKVVITPSPAEHLSPAVKVEEPTPLYDESGLFVGEALPDLPWPFCKPNSLRVDVPETTLIFPESLYDGFVPPAPVTSEGLAIDALQRKLQELGSGPRSDEAEEEGEDFQEFLLEDFTVYVISAISGFEMRPLQYLNAKQTGHSQYYFDGVLRVADERYFLERIPFKELSVGNYGPENDSVDGQVWIRSLQNDRLGRELYYKLGQPSKCYGRYFSNFVWISKFAKYVVDFLEERFEKNKPVRIHDFRDAFLKTTASHHRNSPAFKAWFGAYKKRDFRVPASSNVEFLYKEACGVLSPKAIHFHRLFRETLTFQEYKPVLADSKGEEAEVPSTIVTPYVAHCFGHLPCGSVIQPLELSPKVQVLRKKVADPMSLELTKRAARGEASGVEPKESSAVGAYIERKDTLESIKPGDTISVPPDPESLSMWVQEVPHGLAQGDDRWYGLVQTVEIQKRRRVFSIMWYYRPVDTICGVMKYPIRNELFLSNHCTCSDNITIDEDDVLGVHSVSFWPVLEETEFICRQAYDMAERRFTSYKEADRVCICSRPRDTSPVETFANKYRIGDAVLVPQKGQLEPFELVGINAISREATLRRLVRRDTLDASCAPNEVVYTEEFIVRKITTVKRKCYVQVNPTKNRHNIPAPYNRDGVGSLFFMTHFWDGEKCLPLEKQDCPPTLNRPPTGKKLLGLDLFCGVGNFGRGIEEGGAVEMRWANDISDKAIHAYMANADPSRVSPFLGSIDVLQARAIQGRFGHGVPEVGLVSFLAGGSPCPGLSTLTNDKTTPQQRKNQSLVAAFASMVDVYRPRYGILENVVGIVQKREMKREDVFCQLICALVGMGYQAQMFFLDAWSYGSCQSRSRVFLVFAAPGETLPDIPPPSHSHTPDTRNLGLGILANGEKMAARVFHDAYPFPFRSAAAATGDLPDVYDGKSDYCIPFPDHVPSATVTPPIRAQIKAIPHYPPGMNFSHAFYSGVMAPGDRELFPPEPSLRTKEGAVGWGRCRPGGLLSTVTTNQSVTDCKSSSQLHWREERPLTLMEARRAQGLPDGEVLLGGVRDRWKAVGNSVAREVSLALGLALREAIFGGVSADAGAGMGEEIMATKGNSGGHLMRGWTSPLKMGSYPSPLSMNGRPDVSNDAKSDATLGPNGESKPNDIPRQPAEPAFSGETELSNDAKSDGTLGLDGNPTPKRAMSSGLGELEWEVDLAEIPADPETDLETPGV